MEDGDSEHDESDTSSDDDNRRVVVLLAPYLLSRYATEAHHDSILSGAQYYQELVTSSSPTRFYDVARMQLPTFVSLLRDLEGTSLLRQSQRISSGEKLLMFIQVLTRATNRVIAERWQHSSSTVSAVVTEVLHAIAALEPVVITPPAEGTPGHIRSSPKFYPYFKNCIGALDGTHIPVVVPESVSAPFRNRKGDLSQNVLGVCDFDMIFCYALAGWEGSAHDGRVLADAVSRGLPLRDGKYYLGDAGYSLNAYTMTPYLGVRYHLKEWASGNQKPQTRHELFNLRHSSLRNVIERTFGVLKKKFPLLQAMLSYPVSKQVKLVKAAITLHNYIRMMAEDLGPLDELDPSDQTPGVDSDVATSELDDDATMSTLRDDIAAAMWADYCVYIADRDQTIVV